MALTRLQLLNLWLSRVSSDRRRATLVALYQGAPQGMKDAIIAAMKADIVTILAQSKTAFTDGSAAIDAELADVNGVV